MRIAVVGYPLLSRRQWALYTKLDEDEIHLLTPYEWPGIFQSDFPEASDPVHVHQHRAVFGGKMGRYLLPGLLSTIAGIDPDVVLTHGEPWHLNTLYTQLICETVGVPHAVFSWENLARMPQLRTQRALERLLLGRVDGIIAGSEAAAGRLRAVDYAGPTAVAPESGIDTDRFRPDRDGTPVRERFGISPDSRIVLYAGRLASEKGIEHLVESAPAVLKECPDAHFLILGDGDREEYLRNRIDDLGVADGVSLVTERQPYSEMPAIHSLASVFVYPSRTTEMWAEQFGFAVVEAMSSGVPVVTTECGALPHVVGDTGVVCPEDDAEALREAITDLLQDDSRRERLGERARTRAVQEFSLERVAKKHRALLDQLVGP